MAIYNLSITHALQMSGAASAERADLDFIGDDDTNLCAGRKQLTVRHGGVAVEDALAGTVNVVGENIMTVFGVEGLITSRDIEQSNGRVRISDRKFRLNRSDLLFMPVLGDKTVIGSETLEILAVDSATQRKAVMIWCRG